MTGRRRADRLSILDMSMEDDSLLPGAPCSVVKEEDESQEIPAAQATLESKPPVRRSKKTANLRKSLAWNKAFLTGEGVLEPDELPISVRSSPKKLPELPTLEINTTAKSITQQPSDSDAGLSHNAEATSLQQSDTVIPRYVPAKKVIESAIQKGTRLRLPSTITAEQKTALPKESSLSRSVTLVSRKVKDTIGRVLPGRAETTTRVSDGHLTALRDSKTLAPVSLNTGFLSDSHDSSLKREPFLSRSYSAGSRLKQEDSRPKPTGLRAPSPKMGYFDPGKISQSARQTANSGTALNKNATKTAHPMGRLKPRGLPKSRSVHATALGLSAGPTHADFSTSAPSTPRKPSNELLSPSARLAAATSMTPKGTKAKGSRKLAMELVSKSSDSEQENLLAVSEMRKSATQSLPQAEEQNGMRKHSLASLSDLGKAESLLKLPKLKLRRDENLGPTSADSAVPEADMHTRSPLTVNHTLLNTEYSDPKEKGSFFALAKKAVGRLSSPVQDKEREIKDGSLKLRRIPGREVKTGPVQHSPPNKSAPQPGPWSPVRKNGTQLGPFDCTKSNVVWETEV